MVKVLDSGFFCTLQDEGRFWLRNKGVPVAGPMDQYSASMANSLLENEANAAVMEITMNGPKLEFESPTYIAITGAELSPKLNDKPITGYHVHKIEAGDILSFGKWINGLRAYLAVKDGFLTPMVLGSRSMYKPITMSSGIKEHMNIPINSYKDFTPKLMDIKPAPFHKEQVLTVFRGPEYDKLTDKQLEKIFSMDFTVSKENNRMGYQLKEFVPEHSISMLTSATLPGTVQLTPAGKLIILMRDGQTTGGYPRILQLSQRSISILAQKKFRDIIEFKLR